MLRRENTWQSEPVILTKVFLALMRPATIVKQLLLATQSRSNVAADCGECFPAIERMYAIDGGRRG